MNSTLINSSKKVIVYKDISIPMRDNIILCSDLYIPSKAKLHTLPTILIRTPYGKDLPYSFNNVIAHGYRLASTGKFIVAVQDVRGLFNSAFMGSIFNFLSQEGNDGYDTIEWLANPDNNIYGNGKIATIGTSYLGWVQNAAAVLNPPHLSGPLCIFEGGIDSSTFRYTNSLLQTESTTNIDILRPLEMRWLAWPFFVFAQALSLNHVKYNTETISINELFQKFHNLSEDCNNAQVKSIFEDLVYTTEKEFPIIDKYLRHFSQIPQIQEFYQHLILDDNFKTSNYWDKYNFEYIKQFDNFCPAPLLLITGFYDSYSKPVTKHFNILRDSKSFVDKDIFLIIGPWTHGPLPQMDSTTFGELDFGSNAKLGYFDFIEKYLSMYLYPQDSLQKKKGRREIRYFIMGTESNRIHSKDEEFTFAGGRWASATEWPPTDSHLHKLYLHPNKTLDFPIPNINISSNQADEKDSINPSSHTSYIYNPATPTPSIGSAVSSLDAFREQSNTLRPLPSHLREKCHIVCPGPYNQIERDGWIMSTSPGRLLADRSDQIIFQTTPLISPLCVVGNITAVLYVSTSSISTDFAVKLVDVYPEVKNQKERAFNLCEGIIRIKKKIENNTEQKTREIFLLKIELPPTASLFDVGHKIRFDVCSSNYPRFDLNKNNGSSMFIDPEIVIANNTIYHCSEYSSYIELGIIPNFDSNNELYNTDVNHPIKML